VPADRVAAYMWCTLAIERLPPDLRDQINRYRTRLADQMSSSEITEAGDRAKRAAQPALSGSDQSHYT